MKTWFGHDCPPSLAWISHSYITFSLLRYMLESAITKGQGHPSWAQAVVRKTSEFFVFKWVWWKMQTGWMSWSRAVMSKLDPAEVSQLLLFLSLIGQRAWPDKVPPQGDHEKNLMIQEPNAWVPFTFHSPLFNLMNPWILHAFKFYSCLLSRSSTVMVWIQLHDSACGRKNWHVSADDRRCVRMWSSLMCSVTLPSLASPWEPMRICQCFLQLVYTVIPSGSGGSLPTQALVVALSCIFQRAGFNLVLTQETQSIICPAIRFLLLVQRWFKLWQVKPLCELFNMGVYVPWWSWRWCQKVKRSW